MSDVRSKVNFSTRGFVLAFCFFFFLISLSFSSFLKKFESDGNLVDISKYGLAVGWHGLNPFIVSFDQNGNVIGQEIINMDGLFFWIKGNKALACREIQGKCQAVVLFDIDPYTGIILNQVSIDYTNDSQEYPVDIEIGADYYYIASIVFYDSSVYDSFITILDTNFNHIATFKFANIAIRGLVVLGSGTVAVLTKNSVFELDVSNINNPVISKSVKLNDPIILETIDVSNGQYYIFGHDKNGYIYLLALDTNFNPVIQRKYQTQVDTIWDISSDVNGNVYISGYISGYRNDIAYIFKVNYQGQPQWKLLLGASLKDRIYGIDISIGGDILAAGYLDSKVGLAYLTTTKINPFIVSVQPSGYINGCDLIYSINTNVSYSDVSFQLSNANINFSFFTPYVQFTNYTTKAVNLSNSNPCLESPKIYLEPNPVYFPAPSSEYVNIHNKGNGYLEIRSYSLSNTIDFGFTLGGIFYCSPGTVIAPGDYCSVELSFSPTTTNPIIAYFSVESNDPKFPTATVELRGNQSPSLSSGSGKKGGCNAGAQNFSLLNFIVIVLIFIRRFLKVRMSR